MAPTSTTRRRRTCSTELEAIEPENVTYRRMHGRVLGTIANFCQGERRSRALRGYWGWLSGLDGGMVGRLEEDARFVRIWRQVLLWSGAELVEGGDLAAARPVAPVTGGNGAADRTGLPLQFAVRPGKITCRGA